MKRDYFKKSATSFPSSTPLTSRGIITETETGLSIKEWKAETFKAECDPSPVSTSGLPCTREALTSLSQEIFRSLLDIIPDNWL